MTGPKRTKAAPTLTMTNSARSTFIRCRRRYWYSYEQWLRPKGIALPLFIGGAFHKAMATWYSAGSFKEARLAPVLKGVTSLVRDARKGILGEQQLERLEVAHGMLLGLLTAYHSKYLAADLDRWEVLAVEVPFSYPINGTSWRAEGVIDLVARDRRAKKRSIFIWEHKTTSILGEDYVGRLPLDDQIHHYWIGAGEALGERVDGILYNVVQKSKLRQKQKERFTEFCARVEGDYDTDPSKYFWRGALQLPAWSLAEYRAELRSTLLQIEGARADLPKVGKAAYYKNTHHCFQFGACPYVPLCTSNESAEALSLYDRDNSPHPELDKVEEEAWT